MIFFDTLRTYNFYSILFYIFSYTKSTQSLNWNWIISNNWPKIVPPRFTNLLRPAVVIWFSLLKAAYRELWQNWFISSEHSYTKNWNMRSPGYAICKDLCIQLCNKFIVQAYSNIVLITLVFVLEIRNHY